MVHDCKIKKLVVVLVCIIFHEVSTLRKDLKLLQERFLDNFTIKETGAQSHFPLKNSGNWSCSNIKVNCQGSDTRALSRCLNTVF